tara:strand:+ start:4042 stop:4464 length:423 start_codon:yes stop_codon:yes gene_type:complete
MLNPDIPQEYIDELRSLLKDYNLPYIVIEVNNESGDSPLNTIAGKVEAAVNGILGDIFFARMDEGGYLLSSLEGQLDDLITLSAVLRLKHEQSRAGGILPSDLLKKFIEQKKKNINKRVTPIPKAFTDAFKNEQNKKDKL